MKIKHTKIVYRINEWVGFIEGERTLDNKYKWKLAIFISG